MPYSSVSKGIPFSKVFLSDLRFLYASLPSFKSKSVLPIIESFSNAEISAANLLV